MKLEININIQGIVKFQPATTESSIHRAHAAYAAPSPHAGTHTLTHMVMRVAKPIGIVPRKRLLFVSCIMTVQISGHIAYRSTEIENAAVNKPTFSTKKMMLR